MINQSAVTYQANRFSYDPRISAFDATFWKTLTGSDPGITSNKIRINARELASFSFYSLPIDIEWTLNVPVGPTALDARSWGLKTPSQANRGRIEFDITGTAFTAKVYNDIGTALFSKAITWDAAWTATDTRFRIIVTNGRIAFLINDVEVAVYPETVAASAMPMLPCALHINNGNADNLDLALLVVREAGVLT